MLIFSIKVIYLSLSSEKSSYSNNIKKNFIKKRRDIVDRNGSVLATNVILYDVGVRPKLLKEKEKKYLNIVKTSNVIAYEDVEERFRQTHDIDDALFLAKSYYKKAFYKKSKYWALEANKIDDNLEESLLIFVKSKVKLGKRDESISLLKKYIEKTNSEDASTLLDIIENHKL